MRPAASGSIDDNIARSSSISSNIISKRTLIYFLKEHVPLSYFAKTVNILEDNEILKDYYYEIECEPRCKRLERPKLETIELV